MGLRLCGNPASNKMREKSHTSFQQEKTRIVITLLKCIEHIKQTEKHNQIYLRISSRIEYNIWML